MSSYVRENNTLIGRKYKILNKIGSGAFGIVYKGENILTKELVAIKVESLADKSRLLKNEVKICRYLYPNKGFVTIKWFGIDNDNAYAVFNLLGTSLDTYMERLNRFSLRTTMLLGIQMIERIKVMHNNGILHRDIKPDNFLMGKTDTDTLYIIDFGLSKTYVKNGEHIKLGGM